MLSTDWNTTRLINPSAKEAKDIDMDFQKKQSNDNTIKGTKQVSIPTFQGR
jgi:hypothetical protein